MPEDRNRGEYPVKPDKTKGLMFGFAKQLKPIPKHTKCPIRV